MIKVYKVLHPIQSESKVYLPGQPIQLDDEKAKYIMHCLEPLKATEKTPAQAPEPIPVQQENVNQEPAVNQVAIPIKEANGKKKSNQKVK